MNVTLFKVNRLLRVPWTERRSNQSILKEISPRCSLEGVMLKLKLQYFGHLMGRVTHWKRPWCWKGLGSGGERDNRGWDGWIASPTRWTWVWVNSGSLWWIRRPGVLWYMGSQRVGHDRATELNWMSYEGFLGGLDSKESACSAGYLGSIPGPGRFSGEGNGKPLKYSCLGNHMDRRA